ncbi:MAG: NADP-dependent phosphogluconate dehydrogenase, partial [Smithellaceae bacterium]|nr:NADP-dependent phosphogluconate dehydrogenase [Smithellaceae bacterium]
RRRLWRTLWVKGTGKMEKCDIALIGLAVMGQNLVLNMERNGFGVAVYNRNGQITADFLKGAAAGKRITSAYSIEELITLLKRPRVIMIMVKAGAPVDEVIARLKPHLSPGDLVIDGGNSHFPDTERRFREIESLGIHYLGVGVSGGEEGALRGPSIMPGGTRRAYTLIEPLFRAIAAKVDGDPCVTWIGPRGAGHFVKMVHNAIEYGDMQLIAEAYDLLHRGLGLSARELQEVFNTWNEGPLSSYLIEITAKIFTVIDETTNKPLVEMILDHGEQKGTGRWTVQAALDLGVPIPTISAAIDARMISSYKNERSEAAGVFPLPVTPLQGNRADLIRAVGDALYAAKICSYAQGMALLRRAGEEYDYSLDYGEIARIWRGGCIIRARFLDDVRGAFRERPDLTNLLLAPFFRDALLKGQQALRDIVSLSALAGIPLPGMSASLAYFDSYRSPRLPTNLTQAQRDYFGAHTYRRVDREGDFHTKWPL